MPMVINIPSESEDLDATIIYGCPINQEVETQSAKGPQLQQSPRKQQTIPTPGSRPMPNPAQGILDIAGESSALL